MATWKFMTAAAMATLMFAGPAFAQATSGSPATDPSKSEQKPAGDAAKSPDTTKSSKTKSSDTMKSSDMKSDTMKSDKKAGAMDRKGGTAAAGDEKVKAAQQALKDKGHDPGDVDGRMGPKTQAALKDFQKAQGMQASGRLDMKTMQALGMEGKTSSAGSSTTAGSASPSTTGSSDMSKDASKDASKELPKDTAKDPAKDTSGAGSPATGGTSTQPKAEEKK